MNDASESTYAQFLHLTYGLRAGRSETDKLKLWPTGKNALTEVANVDMANVGKFLAAGGLEVVGNEERLWADGYEERIWNPALLPGLGADLGDLPGHDWANIAHSASGANQEAHRLAEAVSMHLRGASLRLMHISEWYHQMLLYSHLKGHGPGIRFANLDFFHFLLDCHSFLVEIGSARDHLAVFAGKAIAGLTRVRGHSDLLKQLGKLPDPLRSIVERVSDDSPAKLSLAHIGHYRDIIVHQNPLTRLGNIGFETFETGITLPHQLLAVKYEIIANPLSGKSDRFDALRAFQAMLRVVFAYSREIAALSPFEPSIPEITPISSDSIPTRRVDFPNAAPETAP